MTPGQRLLDRLLICAILASIALGWAASFRLGLFDRPDEAAHYLRAVEVAHGQWMNPPGDIGVDIPCRDYFIIAAKHAAMAYYRDVTQRLDFELDACRVRSVNTAGAYTPLPYVFLAAGEWAGRKLGWWVEDRLRLMRFFNFVGTALILAIAFWCASRWRAGFVLLGFSPIAVWIRAAASADAVTVAMSLLFLAWVLRLFQQAEPPSTRQWSVLFVLGLSVGACKPVYALVVFFALVLCLRPDPGHARWRAVIVPLVAGCAALALSVAWVRAVDPVLIYLGNGADPQAQAQYMLTHPYEYLLAMLRGIGWHGVQEALVPYAAVLKFPKGLALASMMSATLLAVFCGGPALVSRAGRCFALLFFALLMLAISAALYLAYTAPGEPTVLGLQSRYFLPALGVLMFALGGIARPWLTLRREWAEPLAAFVPLGAGVWLIWGSLSG